MTEHITQNYRGMIQTAGQAGGGETGATRLGASVEGAGSPTASELQPMRSGERWSLTATERAYNAGGNEPGHMTSGSPQQEQP
ncbi:MAG TPA: hypothetical protein VD973_10190 [Symbiobacteriaceae bacterium]|jgi:hypothetical protein|nr:hypothetical protein [Symbiobacteriaceae bacterium]